MIEQLRDAPQRADDVGVFDRSSLLVAHRLDELRHPNGHVDGERRVLERFDMDASAAGLEQLPEALDAHLSRPLLSIGFAALWALRAASSRRRF